MLEAMTESKVALVTGGGRGIGRAISIRLAELGYTVVINFRDDLASAEETLRRCRDAGASKSELCQGNVAAPSHRDLVVEHDGFMHKFESVKPWIIRAEEAAEDKAGRHPEKDTFDQSAEKLGNFKQFSMCID